MRTLIAVLAATAAMLLGAPVAYGGQAAATCDGSMADVVVEGDLFVPAGATCTLDAVHVLRDAVVEADASLTVDFSMIDGRATVGPGGRLWMGDSAIGGDTVCTGCDYLAMVFMWDPRGRDPVRGDIRVAGMTDGRVYLEAGPIDGDVEVTDSSGEFSFIESSLTGKFLFANNVGNAGFWRMSSEKDFVVAGNTSAGGGFPSDFTLEGNRSGKDLVFSDNAGPSELIENYAEKDLECFGNEPAPTGWGNGAGDDVEGQCAALTAPPPE